MKKAIVHYFSGTGNSLLAVKQLGKELTGYGFDIEYHSIEEGVISNPKDYSLHIFAFPVYATSVPHIMRRYIRKLPDGNKIKTAVICTIGRTRKNSCDGYQGWALHQARLYLRIKNYDVFYSERLFYPHNITIALPPTSDDANQLFIKQASEKIPTIAKQIAENQNYHRKFFFLNILWSVPFGVLYALVGRHLFGKLFAVDSSCNQCKLCQKQCPGRTIKTKKNGNWWGASCEGCLRCMNICPKRSIQTSLVRVLLILWATFYNPVFLTLHRYIPKGMFAGSVGIAVFNVLLYVISFIIFVFVMDIILFFLSYIPFFKRVISFGHTIFYGRYHAKHYEERVLNK